MQVNVSVLLTGKEKVADPDATAAALLAALGGDPSKDEIFVHVQTVQDPVRLGPEPTPLPELEAVAE